MKIKQRAGLLTGFFMILVGITAVFFYLDSAYHAESVVNVAVETDAGNTLSKHRDIRSPCGSKADKVMLFFRLPVRE